MRKATAILLAGSRPNGDPLAEHFQVPTKALVPLAGEPMIRRPLAALMDSPCIGMVIVATQEATRVAAAIGESPRIRVERSDRTIAATLIRLFQDPALEWPVLVTTADHALLDAATIDEMIRGASGAQVAIGVVRKDALLRRLPGSKRTWLNFRGESVTGANLFVMGSAAVLPALGRWRSVEQDRKKGLRLLSIAGPLTVAGTVLRLLSLDGVLKRLGRRVGLKLRAVRLSNPLAGVDVDKIEDHALVTAILSGGA